MSGMNFFKEKHQPIIVVDEQDDDNSLKMDSFFSILNEREKQYFIAKQRYEEALNNLEKITSEKLRKFRREEYVGSNIKLPSPDQIISDFTIYQSPIYKNKSTELHKTKRISKNKGKPARRKNMINKNTLLDDILLVFGDSKEPLDLRIITRKILLNGRKFEAKKPSNSVSQELHAGKRSGIFYIPRRGFWDLVIRRAKKC
jgi:hypothetical protein